MKITITKRQELKNLLRREYLRGFIDGGSKGKHYDLDALLKQYMKYIKNNPLRDELNKLKI